jgi:membrane-bound serine protease (ClpP class)
MLGGAKAEAAGPVYKVVVDDIIHGVSARHIIRTIEKAEADNAELVLIQLGTPGGLYESTREIIEAILASKTPVVVYVAPAGAHAASAGFLITLAADFAAMAPGTNTGAATPVSGTGQEIEETLAKKIQSDAAAYTRSIAERRGRPPEIAEKAVTEAKSWTAQEALDAGLIDQIASSEAELLSKLDGVPIRRIDGTGGRDGGRHRREPECRRRIASSPSCQSTSPSFSASSGSRALPQFSNPGMIAPGVIGAIALLAAFARGSSRHRRRSPSPPRGFRRSSPKLSSVLRCWAPAVIPIVFSALMLFEAATPAGARVSFVDSSVTIFLAAVVIVSGARSSKPSAMSR